MAIANPRIHIICGICGSNKDFSYEVNRGGLVFNEGEENEYTEDKVYLSCNNCGSLTSLDELMESRK